MDEIVPTTDRRSALVAGLRELADLIEANPTLPAPRYPRLNVSLNERAEVEAAAEVLGRQAEEHWAKELGRLHSVQAERSFGPLEVVWYAMDEGAHAEYLDRDRFAKAARWVFTCTDEPDDVSAPFPTEAAANAALADHAEGCSGSHTVHLVSGEPVGSTR